MTDQFGFGDFVFRLPDQPEVARAADLNALEANLLRFPPKASRTTRRAIIFRAG